MRRFCRAALLVAVFSVACRDACAGFVITQQAGEVYASTNITQPETAALPASGGGVLPVQSGTPGYIFASATLNYEVESNRIAALLFARGEVTTLPNQSLGATASASLRVDFLLTEPSTVFLTVFAGSNPVQLFRADGSQIFSGGNASIANSMTEFALGPGGFWIQTQATGFASHAPGSFRIFTSSASRFEMSVVPAPPSAFLLALCSLSAARRGRR